MALPDEPARHGLVNKGLCVTRFSDAGLSFAAGCCSTASIRRSRKNTARGREIGKQRPGRFIQSPAKFHAQEVLKHATPRVLRQGFALFPHSTVPSVDVRKLIYFAISMFWRGTLQWSSVDGARPERIYLGRYEDQYADSCWAKAAYRRTLLSRLPFGPSKNQLRWLHLLPY